MIVDRHWRRAAASGAASSASQSWSSHGHPCGTIARVNPDDGPRSGSRRSRTRTSFCQRVAALGLDGEPRLAGGPLAGAHDPRAPRHCRAPVDRALVWGATALVAIFLLTIPAVALACGSSPCSFNSRVCSGSSDLLVAIYGVAALGESLRGRQEWRCSRSSCSRPRSRVARNHRARACGTPAVPGLAARHALDSMRCDGSHASRSTPTSWPIRDIHGSTGSSVRVAAERDVLLEDDEGLGDRDVQSRPLRVRVVERRRGAGRLSRAERRRRRVRLRRATI